MMTVPQALELAVQHHQAGRLGEAEALYRQILAVQPGHVDALQMLGCIAHQAGRYDRAVELIGRAIALYPEYPAAHSNLGEAYRAMGRLEEAVASYRRALQIKPDYPVCHYNLGNVLKDQGHLDEAIAEYRCALRLQSNLWEACNNLGNALKDQGEIAEAIAAYRRAHELNPGHAEVNSNIVFTLHFLPGQNGEAIAHEQKCWNERFGASASRAARRHDNDRNPERRLRIGYVSPDFRKHAVGWNLMPLFERHDRGNFEIVCYSGVIRPDEVTAELQKRAQHWRGTVGVSDEALAEMIRQDGVDILVDLSLHTNGNRLPVFAWQPAPVQVSFAGYPESTGVESIKYRISDRYLEGGTVRGANASEEQVCLIDSFWCYDPGGVEVKVNALPAKENGRVTFGSLNNFCKINEPLLKLWARVLAEVRDAHLVFLCGFGQHRQRTCAVLEQEGVAPERVEFAEPGSRRAYLELYHRLDVVLDPFPYNGHMTSLDALWMGVPVVSLAGQTPLARGGLSILTNLGLPELVAESEEEYVAIAARLASDLPRLAELRQTLRARMEASVLMDAERFARGIEGAYRAMWRQWCDSDE